MSKQRLLFIKQECLSYSSVAMLKAFQDVGYDVLDFDWQKCRFENGIEKLNEEVIRLSKGFSPDVTFVHIQLPNVFTTETFKALAENSFVINFTEDVREDTSWYEDAAPHIGLTVFTNLDDVEKFKSKGIDNVTFMPTSYNDLWYRPMPKTEKYYGDIVFVGNNYLGTNHNFPKSKERYDMVQYLKKEFGERFQVYGLNWGKEIKMLNPAQSIEAYNNAKIVITQNNFERKGYQSDRAFNAIGCGAFVIAQYFDGIEEQFDGKLFWWDNFYNLADICNNILDSPKYIENAAEKENEVVVNNHRWVNRFDYLKQFIK